jgi:hypothetical protein
MDGLEDGSYEPEMAHQSHPSSYSSETTDLAQPSVAMTSAQYVVPADYSMRPVNNVSDLLPTDTNSDWAKLNPGLNAGATPDLLSAGTIIGIGQNPLRNANLQFRSDPPIIKQDIGPWNQSTIEPDMSRVPLEIGYSS